MSTEILLMKVKKPYKKFRNKMEKIFHKVKQKYKRQRQDKKN